MPSKYITVNGVVTNYFHTGPSTLPTEPPALDRGALLVFIHAAGSNANTWARQLAHFNAAHSAVALDFPGHGRSGSTEGLPSVTAYRDFTAAFLSALQTRPAVLVGRSMGGAIAMEVALAYPERVRALVLVATAARFALDPQRIETWRNVMLGRMTQPFTTEAFSPKADFAVVREAWMEQVKTDPRVRYHDLVACSASDITARLGQIRHPTLIIAGRDDAITPPVLAEELHDGIRDSRLIVIDDAGHTIPSEKPAEFNAAVEQFLGGLHG